MKMRRILLATILAVAPLAIAAQSSIAGVGLYGTTPTPMLNGGAGYGSTQYAPASVTLYGYNPSGLTPALATYISGITATGSAAQTCTLTFTGGTTQAVGTVKLSATNAVATGSVVTFSTVGTGYIAPPTAATASNGTATCSGTVVVSTALGAYAPFAVDASGNLLISGGGTVSGQANGVVPLATASTVIGAQSHLSDNGTTMSFSESVGIGTTAPQTSLDVEQGSVQGGIYIIGSNFPLIEIGSSAASGFQVYWAGGQAYIGTNGNNYPINFAGSYQAFGATETMRVTGGKVGIGTTSPGSTLTVKGGDAFVDGTATGVILRDTVVTTNCYRITIASGLVVPTLVTCPTD